MFTGFSSTAHCRKDICVISTVSSSFLVAVRNTARTIFSKLKKIATYNDENILRPNARVNSPHGAYVYQDIGLGESTCY